MTEPIAYMVYQGTADQIRKIANTTKTAGNPAIIASFPQCPPGRDITDEEWIETLRSIQNMRAEQVK